MVVVHLTLAADDLAEVCTWLVRTERGYRHRRWMETIACPASVLLFATLVAVMGAGLSGFAVVAFMLLLGFSHATWRIWTTFPKRKAEHLAKSWARKSPSLTQIGVPQRIEVTDGGVVVEMPHVTSTFKWSAFTDYADLPNSVALWQERVRIVLIPKRSLSEDGHRILANILSSNLRAA